MNTQILELGKETTLYLDSSKVTLLFDLVSKDSKDLKASELNLGSEVSAAGILSSRDSAETPFLMLTLELRNEVLGLL